MKKLTIFSPDEPPDRPSGRALQLVVGTVAAAIGVFLTLRPFTSLSVLVALVALALAVTGISEFLSAREDRSRAAMALGVLWVVGGLVTALWPAITVRVVALVVGVALLVTGMRDLISAVRAGRPDLRYPSPLEPAGGRSTNRVSTFIKGLSSIVFGVLALAWPDVTLLVVAVVFGVRTAHYGLTVIWSAIESHRGEGIDDRRSVGSAGRALRMGSTVGLLILALALAALSVALHRTTGRVDDFYSPPDRVPSAPGKLLRVEAFHRGIPADAEAFRILYTTTRAKSRPALASALVVVPKDSKRSSPVVAWAHGTTGVAQRCAPSIMPSGLESGAMMILDQVVKEGWALVATDYTGLGTKGPHPYLIGDSEARSVLDAVRAARQMNQVDLADKTVVWGHSQGGGAALWTGQIAPTYAPDVALSGVAALAPASDLAGFTDTMMTMPGGSIFAAYIAQAYSAEYQLPLRSLVRSTARTSFDRATARCLDGTVLASALTSLAAGMDMFAPTAISDLTPFLAENTPTGPFQMPVLIGQGAADPLIRPEVQRKFAAGLCQPGQLIDYRTYAGRGHVALVERDSPLIPDLIEWTRARFGGQPPSPNCPR